MGERIAAAPPLPDVGLLLVNPGIPVATGQIFTERRGPFSAPAAIPGSFGNTEVLMAALAACRNDLESSARAMVPQISDVLAAINSQEGCLLARLSGSGATCFGLFDALDGAVAAASRIRDAHTRWWVHAGRFLTRAPALQRKDS